MFRRTAYLTEKAGITMELTVVTVKSQACMVGYSTFSVSSKNNVRILYNSIDAELG
jgi:hypothetical protein